MYQQELKEPEGAAAEEREKNQSNSGHIAAGAASAQTPTPATTSTATAPPPSTPTTPTTAKRSDINATESDPSLVAINRQAFSENQAKQHHSTTAMMDTTNTTTSEMEPPVSQCFDSDLPPPHRSMAADDTCRQQGSLVTADYGTTSAAADIGSTLIRFGTTAGDVSLTLGLRHAGNMPEKTPFSVRDFGGI